MSIVMSVRLLRHTRLRGVGNRAVDISIGSEQLAGRTL
jgi:hypothetical protein